MPSEIRLVATVILGLVALGAVAYVVTLFNNLVQLANNIRKAWGNIDVLLLQRNEELGKLVELTRAYVPYEAGSLDALTRLRTCFQSASRTEQKARAANDLLVEIHALEHVWEAYPDLKADEAFLQLQGRVSAVEDSIADRRTFFNRTAEIYNIQRERFPQRLLAGMLGFRPHPYLDLPGGRR
jgi:LemA protein